MINTLNVVSVRLKAETPLVSESPIRQPSDAVNLMCQELSQYDREVLCVLNMDNQKRVINMNIASIGTINASLATPREIFKASILSNAASIILMHNHPSGDITPSVQDRKVTQLLVTCGHLLGISVEDHLIVGGNHKNYYSFREHNELPSIDKTFFVAEKRKTAKVHI